jgi:DUF4097 and DUF4098 domain-containing protein YvlB
MWGVSLKAVKNPFRGILIAALIAASVLTFSIGVISPVVPPFVGRPDVEKVLHLKWGAKPSLQLKNNQGSVSVVTSEGKEIVADVRIRGYQGRAEDTGRCYKYLEKMMHVQETGSTLQVEVEPDERPADLELLVDIELAVPRGTDVDIRCASGNVWVGAGCRDVRVRGRNTDIGIDHAAGDVLATSTNGQIRVVGAKRDTNIETVNGNVYAHLQGGSLQASTMNGAIVTRILDPDVRYCDLTTQNGGITLVLNKKCAAFVEARTERGLIRSDCDVDSSHGVNRSRHLEGNIGSGRMYLSMKTLNGNVRIRQE